MSLLSEYTSKNKKKKLGRKPDWGDREVIQTAATLPVETYEAIKVALATTHKGLKTQNKLINAAILAYLDNAESNKLSNQKGFKIKCKYCRNHVIMKSHLAKFCSDKCRSRAYYSNLIENYKKK